MHLEMLDIELMCEIEQQKENYDKIKRMNKGGKKNGKRIFNKR